MKNFLADHAPIALIVIIVAMLAGCQVAKTWINKAYQPATQCQCKEAK